MTSKRWSRGFAKGFGGLAQGDNLTGKRGSNTVFVMTHNKIAKIPRPKTVTYARVVPDYRPQKEDPYRIRITAGGNLIKTTMELTTRTADLTTAKIIWNSTISTPGAKCAYLDIKNFYLGTRMKDYEYMKIFLKIFPEHVIKQYNLLEHAKGGYVYLEI